MERLDSLYSTILLRFFKVVRDKFKELDDNVKGIKRQMTKA